MTDQFDCYFDKILNDLIQGYNKNIIIYEPSLNRNNLLDTKLILSLSPLFNNTTYNVHINLSQIINGTTQSLLDQNTLKVTNINDMLRHYKLGLAYHSPSATTKFTIEIKKENKISRLTITNISSPDQITQDDTTLLLTSISHLDDTETIKNTLEATSHLRVDPTPEAKDHLRQTILKMTSELTRSRGSLQSIASNKAYSTFSSISNFTHLTIPEEEKDDCPVEISCRQKDTEVINRLIEIQRVQDELIECLQGQMAHRQQEIMQGLHQLALDRDEIRQMALQNEEIGEIQAERDRLANQLKEHQQISEKTQNALDLQTARCKSLEKRTAELQADLVESRDRIKQHDVSGMIEKLERELDRLKRQKQLEEEDFEKSYADALNEIKSMKTVMDSQTKTIEHLQATTQSLYQQLNDLQCIEKRNSMSSSIISAYGQYNHLEMDEVMKNLCDENVNLKSALAKQESQKTTQHREMTRQIRSLENDVAKLTAAKNLLERDLHQVAPLRSKLPRSFSSFSRLKDLDPVHVTIAPPPTHPPSEPIPPLPQEENKKQRLSRDDLQAQVDHHTQRNASRAFRRKEKDTA
ncbi:hypothetical protein G6F42_006607 [Rhizopus arrhizus]|nr:hypothetical protein G6F42_006607 [Rhizopus arrhizus]